jgi:hypothetical protein
MELSTLSYIEEDRSIYRRVRNSLPPVLPAQCPPGAPETGNPQSTFQKELKLINEIKLPIIYNPRLYLRKVLSRVDFLFFLPGRGVHIPSRI